jgi:hypothetical protein
MCAAFDIHASLAAPWSEALRAAGLPALILAAHVRFGSCADVMSTSLTGPLTRE